MEDDLKDNATKNNEFFGYGRQPHFFLLRKMTLKQVKVLSPDVFVPVTFI